MDQRGKVKVVNSARRRGQLMNRKNKYYSCPMSRSIYALFMCDPESFGGDVFVKEKNSEIPFPQSVR